jgi:hypothetical protein
VSFEPAGGAKQTFAIRGHAVDLLNDTEEEEEKKKKEEKKGRSNARELRTSRLRRRLHTLKLRSCGPLKNEPKL